MNLMSPSGQVFPARLTKNPNGFTAFYTPFEVGVHTIHVAFAGQPVPKSPFTTTAVLPAGARPAKGDPGKVKAYGPGLQGGTANKPADFSVDTREAGPGGLGLTIEGPVEAKIDCFDKGDGTCDVRYWPTVPGEYLINLTFAEQPTPASPYRAQIKPSDKPGVVAEGPGLGPDGNKRCSD